MKNLKFNYWTVSFIVNILCIIEEIEKTDENNINLIENPTALSNRRKISNLYGVKSHFALKF